MDEFRCDLISAEQLRALVAAPLPLGLRASPATRTLFRDLYLDTPDDELRRRGVTCRLRVGFDDRRTLTLRVADEARGHGATLAARHDAAVRSADPRAALAEDTSPARRLRALVDPARLVVRLELEVERWQRTALRNWRLRPALVLQYDATTCRRGDSVRSLYSLHVRGAGRHDMMARLAAAFQREGLRVGAEHPRERAELWVKWGALSGIVNRESGAEEPGIGDRERGLETPDVESRFPVPDSRPLDPELSLLAFQERVLTLAEDPTTPLRERLRFLAIVGANVDELFTVRIAGLKRAARETLEERGGDGLAGDAAANEALLARIAARVRALGVREQSVLRGCLADLEAVGVRVRRWHELDAGAQTELRARFRDEVYPALTPLAMTLSAGHPFPRVTHLALSLALVLPDDRGGAPHFADIELPRGVPRFLAAADGDVVALEEVVRANLDLLYPEAAPDSAYCFRVTRGGDLDLDEEALDLLEAVDEATRRRPLNAVVRVEVERGMPAALRELILDELVGEPLPNGAEPGPPLGGADVYEVDGMLDLRGLEELPVPPRPELAYPPFRGRGASGEGAAMLDRVRERDRLYHHPFDDFDGTVGRFFREAAADPAVVGMKATLYRIGEESAVVDALLEAARRGKEVVVFVELKARFDEERNVAWARALEEAGGRVVYGFVELKNHAKAGLVVRRESDFGRPGRTTLRRYVHVGTGNYNGRSARQYTDLSLLTADEDLAADVADLFNDLTGSSRAPRRLTRGALVAPVQLLPGVLEMIEREAAHARAGRPASIRLKLNGLSDSEVVQALHRAAGDGVNIELVVRGICTLRPGVPGLSERIRVVSVVGRFLEHSRIYHFANGGAPVWYIGSCDLRPRNLRRRVELLVPVKDAAAREALARILDVYLGDDSAWTLASDGSYRRREVAAGSSGGSGAQEHFLREASDAPAVTGSRRVSGAHYRPAMH